MMKPLLLQRALFFQLQKSLTVNKIWDYPKLQKLTAKTAETQWVLQQPLVITEEAGESKVQDEA